jgi:hypothetical protein
VGAAQKAAGADRAYRRSLTAAFSYLQVVLRQGGPSVFTLGPFTTGDEKDLHKESCPHRSAAYPERWTANL